MVSTCETININADDFTDHFLTCPTCMGHYDNSEHHPKLLPCSHTLCRTCLDRIASTAIQYTNQNSSSSVAAAAAAASTHSPTLLASLNRTSTLTSNSSSSTTLLLTQTPIIDLCFRCPICRETIILPRGGVNAFPPSFIVNQLLDLVGRQRRDLVPRCTNHTNEELLFCETCDSVFCSQCESHCRIAQNSDHIVIPFSIAIKRMSEILLFKSNQCVNSFALAIANVNHEIEKLNLTVENVADIVNKSFNELKLIIDKKREETLSGLCKIRDKKQKLLNEQINLITNEKCKVENECKEYENKIDIRFITQRIQNLNEKLDHLRTLCEPRENSFIKYEYNKNFECTVQQINTAIQNYGKFKTSNTYPSLCKATLPEDASCNLKTMLNIHTVDYYGNARNDGGDPITCFVYDPNGIRLTTPVVISDQQNGQYKINFLPIQPGMYKIDVSIFDRPISSSPFQVEISEHINCVWSFYGKGKDSNEFNMPVSVRYLNELVYVLDSGNNRIKVISKTGKFVRHIENIGLSEASCTSICVDRSTNNGVMSINWRLKMLTQFNLKENLYKNFLIDKPLLEPISIMETFNPELYLILDSKKLFLCNSEGKVVYENIDEKMRNFCGIKAITSYCCSLDFNKQKRVYVADSTSTIYEFDYEWLMGVGSCSSSNSDSSSNGIYYCRKFSNLSQNLSSSTVSLVSNNSLNNSINSVSTTSTSSSLTFCSKGTYTCLCFDEFTGKLLAAKCDKLRTVIEIFNCETHLYEYSID
jgi:tripartite motif-containing protein 2/3